MPIIANPIPDLELTVPRTAVEYQVVLPSQGIGQNTGLALYIHGYGGRFNDPYTCKLLPYLADTYDCVAVCVDYQGAVAQTDVGLRPAPNFFAKLKEHYGVSIAASANMEAMEIVRLALLELGKRGITSLHQDCVLMKEGSSYINFGLLPALDHLQVTHAVLEAFPIDRRRIFVIGTSYGGYLALLMAKFAPNTFKMAIDNCGFSGPDGSMATIFGVNPATFAESGVKVHTRTPIAFCETPGNKYSFTDDRRIVREIAVDAHYQLDGGGIIYSYHSAIDKIAPLKEKIVAAQVLAKYRNHVLRIIDQDDIDGVVFKHPEHGMGASMRGLFDLSYKQWLTHASDMPATTDFDLETVNILPCADKLYIISMSTAGVTLSIC